MIHILVYVLAVPCPLGFMLLEILAMIMKYIYLSIYEGDVRQDTELVHSVSKVPLQ